MKKNISNKKPSLDDYDNGEVVKENVSHSQIELEEFSDQDQNNDAEKDSGLSEIQRFYVSLWDKKEAMDSWGKRYVACFETGKRLYRNRYRLNWSCYSHILPKSRYNEYKMEEFNVKIVDPNSHFLYETSPELAKKQYGEYKKLLALHKKGEL